MRNFRDHLILQFEPLKIALAKLNMLAADSILFVVDSQDKLLGSLTDGDVRRGFLAGLSIDDEVLKFVQANPKYIQKADYCINDIIEFRNNNFRIIPVLDENRSIVNVINFRYFRSYLPIDTIIMAGGRGQRLKPLTDTIPKPLLPVGDKPILEHNIDRLASYGIDDFWISVRYLGEQIEAYFGDGKKKNVSIDYVWEKDQLGTIGAASKIDGFKHDYVLVTNSDILTNLDYEDFFLDFINTNADCSVLTVPYNVNIPYAVLEMESRSILNFKEKPTYTYYSNGGIYLLRREILNLIPSNQLYNATDLLEDLIKVGKKVISYPMRGYWLDIGREEDYNKAQEDIKHISV